MFGPLSQRLLTLLQLTRMALVFTAISNSLCAALLQARWLAGSDGTIGDFVSITRLTAVAIMSIGLYSFGMSLNDIIDRRRDSLLAAHRPIPSGRIGLAAAHVVCAIMGVAALLAGAYLARIDRDSLSIILLLFTMFLISFYDFAGKYLVPIGLLTLGLIRFFHAVVPAPKVPLLWHPLLLLNHVAILSTFAYKWEAKRPALTRAHWWAVLGGLATADAVLIGVLGYRRHGRLGTSWADAVSISPQLIVPGIAIVAFMVVALVIRRNTGTSRRGGQSLMLFGLLWLIVYDAAFAAAYVGLRAAGVLLLLLPLAYLSVQIMRWWANILSLTQKPEFQRAR